MTNCILGAILAHTEKLHFAANGWFMQRQSHIYLFSVTHCVVYLASLEKIIHLRIELEHAEEKVQLAEEKAELYKKISNAITAENELLRKKHLEEEIPKGTTGNQPDYNIHIS